MKQTTSCRMNYRVLRRGLPCLFACAVGSAPAIGGGVPTFDATGLAQQILMVDALQNQVRTLQQQYGTMTRQVDGMTGNRGLGQIHDAPTLSSYLPREWQSVYEQVRAGQVEGIGLEAQSILAQEGLSASSPGQTRYNQTLAANKAMNMRAYEATLQRLENIKTLMRETDRTQDPAAKADLQNRWQAENAMIANERMRLGLMTQLQAAEEKLAQAQSDREFKAKLSGESR
jgi:type IV secretion system protein VirB5